MIRGAWPVVLAVDTGCSRVPGSGRSPKLGLQFKGSVFRAYGGSRYRV